MSDHTAVMLTLRKKDYLDNIELLDIHKSEVTDDNNGTVHLPYYDVNHGNLEFEHILQNERIAYDKQWDNGSEYVNGNEYFRVLGNGKTTANSWNNNEEDDINLSAALASFESGNIEAFLLEKKIASYIMPWDEQIKIMLLRDAAKEYLMTLSEDDLHKTLMLHIPNVEKERITSEIKEYELNTKQDLIGLLLDNGWSIDAVEPPAEITINKPKIDGSSDEVQFTRLLAEINATCEISSNDWDCLCDSMNATKEEIKEVFGKASNNFEKIKQELCQ